MTYSPIVIISEFENSFTIHIKDAIQLSAISQKRCEKGYLNGFFCTYHIFLRDRPAVFLLGGLNNNKKK